MTRDDRPALCRVLQDPEVMYAYEHAFSDAEVRDWLDRQLERYGEYGFGLWAVERKQDGRVIGQCGLTMQDWAGRQVLEVGYLFQKDAWHQGFAAEAAVACRDYAFTCLGAEEVFSIIRDNNYPSQNVAIRSGMTIRGTFIKHYYGVDMPHLVFPSAGRRIRSNNSMWKKIRIPLAAVLAAALAVLLSLGIPRLVIWSRFEPPQIIGSTVATMESDLEKLSFDWFTDYFEQFKGWRVPPDWRVASARIDSMEPLGDNFIQVNYTVTTARGGGSLIQALGLIGTGAPRVYEDQMVLQWEPSPGRWTILDEMRPAAWQIAYSPEGRAERDNPPPEHYQISSGEDMTYAVLNETLYITFDGGATLTEVPDGYDLVCGDANGRYHERLPDNGYIVSPEFSAFLTFDDQADSGAASLLYSTDAGASWQTAPIAPWGYWAASFLSLTEGGVYATFAVDRALGSDYYATYFSSDLQTWDPVQLPPHQRNYTCVYWAAEGVGYYPAEQVSYTETLADGTTQETIKTNLFYLTRDNGASYQELEYPPPGELAEELGFNPFDTLEKMYREDGVIYMVVGQGDDGDYGEDGVIVSGLYRSEDGENFTFVKTIDNTRPLAG